MVANRAIPSFRLLAIDRDSTMVYYSASFRTSTSQASFEGMVPGLKLNRLTGEISGTPAFADRYTVTITATDSEGATDVLNLSFEVLSESLSAELRTRDDGVRKLAELVFTAADTSRAGTTAYCIRPDARQPAADDACFGRTGEEARTLVAQVVAGVPVLRHYLFTKNAAGAVLAAAAAPSAPFSRDLWDEVEGPGKTAIGVQTSVGAFVVELDTDKAPGTTANFLQYVDERFFDGTVFHRINSDFVIQGGGFVHDASATPAYRQKGIADGLRAAIPLERTSTTGLSNRRGSLAMARTNAADSATSQFFISLVDNSATLDAGGLSGADGYAAFGRLLPDAGSATSPFPAAIVTLRDTPTTAEGTLGTPGEASLPVGAPPSIRYILRMR
jgi:cyclophilin family peptidyl-prolyl cis-trans isomerase